MIFSNGVFSYNRLVCNWWSKNYKLWNIWDAADGNSLGNSSRVYLELNICNNKIYTYFWINESRTTYEAFNTPKLALRFLHLQRDLVQVISNLHYNQNQTPFTITRSFITYLSKYIKFMRVLMHAGELLLNFSVMGFHIFWL